ncbi:MAG: SPFH domain-containing protein [bacterium]|jgi:hypothetical protein|nr:SPFH domain-containing protein [bacterium]
MFFETILIIGVVAAIAFGLYIWWKHSKKPVLVVVSPPEKDLVFKRIPNQIEHYEKLNLLPNPMNTVLVFRKSCLIETIKTEQFIIKDYATAAKINLKDNDFAELDFYSFNGDALGNTTITLQMPIEIKDPVYDLFLKITPKGVFHTAIVDIDVFFHTIGLFQDFYSIAQLETDLRSEINSYITNGIAEFAYQNEISILVLNYYLDEIETFLKEKINQYLHLKGIQIDHFDLSDISFEETKEVANLNAVLIRKQKYLLQGYSYRDEKKKELFDRIQFKAQAKVNVDSIVKDDIQKSMH